ncbi:hypothetical protein ACFY0F_22610 [Streptomyces sp. NPDC001544]|uniref:hypothetical protein n=1 Tax=Streptomyces sp. NPDC001544 TaxID=3364584 RepID=UPI00367B602A
MVTAPEKAVVLKPVDLSYEQAAALPTVGVTAYQTTAEIRPGQVVFVNGCLGGVGRAAAQFARARGASVAGSCRNPATDEARELGAEPVVGFDFDPAALAERFDLVLDTPGLLDPVAVVVGVRGDDAAAVGDGLLPAQVVVGPVAVQRWPGRPPQSIVPDLGW